MYFGDAYFEEEAIILRKLLTCRTKTLSDIPDKSHEIFSCDYIIPRGIKLSQSDYVKSFNILSANGLHLISSPESYEISNSAKKSLQILGNNAPKIYSFDAKLTDSEILNTLKSSTMFPLFIRSEKESAAKYVGVDGCIVLDESTFLIAIKNLRENVTGFKKIIFKEALPIKEDVSTKKKLEYRVIAINGNVINFDYDKSLPSPSFYGLDKYSKKLVKELAGKGFNGAYFMDFAIRKSRDFFVVENKNLIKGTIVAIDDFIRGLSKL